MIIYRNFIERLSIMEASITIREKVPLSQTQLGIYFECMRMDGCAYNWHSLYTLDKNIDMERLARSVEKVVLAHPYMEVRISDDGGGLAQYIPETKSPYHQTVTRISESQWQERLQTLVAEPLNLKGGRLFRFDLVETECGKYMLRTTHHIAFDGMSHNIIMNDIAAAYDGAELSQETYNALDVAEEEAQLRASEEYQRAKEWYEAVFSGLETESLPMPDMNEADSHDVFVHEFALSEADMKTFCREKNVSTSALTSAAFALLTGIYANQQESLFTTIYHGRSNNAAHIVGMFVKTLPVYAKWNNSTGVTDFLMTLSEQIQCARDNSIFSFADVNQICQMNNAPMFAWHGAAGTHAEVCEKPAREELLDKSVSDAPLSAELRPVASGLSLRVEYNAGRYSAEFVRTFAETYENILRQLMAKEYIRDIEPCPENSDALRLLDSFNDTDSPYDDTQTVISLFRKSAASYPDNTAVVFGDKRYTYSELDSLSDKIAGYVSLLGLGRGDVVSVLIPRCEYMLTASLGALKAGCAYQPLDSTYPPERLSFMVQDSGAGLLITTEELRPLVSDYSGEVLLLKDIPALPDSSATLPEVKPEDLFILLYTSGSTGTPKGVRLTHGNLVCFINWDKKTNHLTEKSRAAEYASYGFDMHMMGIYPPLTAGASVHIIGEDMRLDFAALQKYIDDEGITHAFITTQVGRQFAEYYPGHSLRYLYVAGEKLAPVFPENKSFTFFNAYGPTETTMLVSSYPVTRKEDNIPIGKALDNMRLYVVDSAGHRVPAGALGELWIAGPQVGDGYLNRPEKTAEVFIANPFDSSKPRAYRTGDIVRYRHDGNIEFIGRRDGQVKIRGFRIELTEVEAVIREFPGVKDATVAAFDTPDGSGKYIAAYVVGDEKIDINALNDFIRERKPPYMIPSATMQIDSIPLNQNQKVNRKALPKPEIQTANAESSKASAPLNILERDIKAIIAEIIGTDSFGLTDTLGNFGLTSISSIRLATQVYKKYGVQLKVRRLVSEGSVQSIENEILSKLLLSHEEKSESVQTQAGKKRSCGLTFEQQGVYADCQIDPASTVYNTPFAVKLPDGITAEQLRDAVLGVVEAHPYILCRFTANDRNEIVQEPIPDFRLEIPVKEMTPQEYESYCKEGFVRPFNLSEGPLARFEIVKADGLYLLMDMHHLVTDGASVDIFLHQLCAKLDGHEAGTEEYSYYDYAADERMSEGAEEFFAGRMALSDEATQIIPDIYGDNLKHSEESVSVKTNIKAVKEFALKNGVTPAEVYLAAGYITFSRFVCDDTVSILTISNGRGNMKIHDTLGMFVNSLPLVETVNNSETVADFIKRAAKNFNDTLLHENYADCLKV